jgi:hypothetical protein
MSHRGDGIGDVFKSLWQFLKPLAVDVAKGIGQESLSAGGRILSNLAQGADLRDTVSREGQAGVKRILESASKSFQKGNAIQTGKGLKRRRKHIKGPAVGISPMDISGYTRPTKRVKTDSLGFY